MRQETTQHTEAPKPVARVTRAPRAQPLGAASAASKRPATPAAVPAPGAKVSDAKPAVIGQVSAPAATASARGATATTAAVSAPAAKRSGPAAKGSAPVSASAPAVSASTAKGSAPVSASGAHVSASAAAVSASTSKGSVPVSATKGSAPSAQESARASTSAKPRFVVAPSPTPDGKAGSNVPVSPSRSKAAASSPAATGPSIPVEAVNVVELDLKRSRKARERALETEVHGALLDSDRDPTERAAEGFVRLAEKLIADVNEQFERVQALQARDPEAEAVDGEIARLLRMIEKRSKIFGEVEEALRTDRRPS